MPAGAVGGPISSALPMSSAIRQKTLVFFGNFAICSFGMDLPVGRKYLPLSWLNQYGGGCLSLAHSLLLFDELLIPGSDGN